MSIIIIKDIWINFKTINERYKIISRKEIRITMICRNQRMKANAEKVELREQHFLSLTPMNSIVTLNEQGQEEHGVCFGLLRPQKSEVILWYKQINQSITWSSGGPLFLLNCLGSKLQTYEGKILISKFAIATFVEAKVEQKAYDKQ